MLGKLWTLWESCSVDMLGKLYTCCVTYYCSCETSVNYDKVGNRHVLIWCTIFLILKNKLLRIFILATDQKSTKLRHVIRAFLKIGQLVSKEASCERSVKAAPQNEIYIYYWGYSSFELKNHNIPSNLYRYQNLKTVIFLWRIL